MANGVTTSDPDPFRRDPNNGLRVNMYRILLERIQAEDQAAGNFGYVLNWDDPAAAWDTGNPADVWDALGFRPVLQTLFYVLESKMGDELALIEDLDTLTDPYTCPEKFLPILAASFGYDLEESITVKQKRQAIQGLIVAYKTSGQEVGFRVFYRLAGFKIVRVFPLWKVAIKEDRNRYSRERYVTVPELGETVGPSGNLGYTGRLSATPIRPGSIRITDGVQVVRDEPPPEGFLAASTAPLLANDGSQVGVVDYFSGTYSVTFPVVTVGVVTADYEQVTEEFPYHAARIDIELSLNPGGDLIIPVPLVDDQVVRNVLRRAEEARPVHVVLRALTLVAELTDDFSPGATDQQACVTKLRDRRDPDAALGTLGAFNEYFLDSGMDATDEIAVDQIQGGVLVDRLYAFEEEASIVCPLDALIIQQGANPPEYW